MTMVKSVVKVVSGDQGNERSLKKSNGTSLEHLVIDLVHTLLSDVGHWHGK